jgi:ubiquinol-cytochrome c reductase cytochrome b subunit
VFPGHWSFFLGEVALFAFVGLVASGVYLALFYQPGIAPEAYTGPAASFAGRTMPEAFVSVLELSASVPFGLVVRRFHHFAAHLFMGSIVLHAARVYFTGAFRRPREVTWWIGLLLFGVGLVNGFTGYCLPFDMRGGTALRMMMTTLESVPWVGAWLATLAFGAPFPGPYILGRLYIEHVFAGPALIALLLGVHLLLVVRLTHTQYPRRDRDPLLEEHLEVGGRLWPEQTARSTALAFFVFALAGLLSAFFPVEAVQAYGPFQRYSSYGPLSPDWFLMWIEGAYRLVPGQLDFHLLGASFTQPFYGAILLPLVVFGGCAAYPFIDARLYPEPRSTHVLDRARDRPLRTALGASGLSFLFLLSIGVLDDVAAGAFEMDVSTWNLLWDFVTLGAPPLVFAAVGVLLRRRIRRVTR